MILLMNNYILPEENTSPLLPGSYEYNLTFEETLHAFPLRSLRETLYSLFGYIFFTAKSAKKNTQRTQRCSAI